MTKKILFIEDEAALQQTTGDMLRSEGYEVLQALDGEAGLRMALQEKPDLILLDLVLPRKDGFEVLTQLRASPEMGNVPVIVLTNLEKSEEVERALQLGAPVYLVKLHYSLEEVLEKVKAALGNNANS